MDFDETENSLLLSGSGCFTDIYNAGSSPVTTNPMTTDCALTYLPYTGGEHSGSPETVYQPSRRLYNHEYAHQFPNQGYYNDQPHSLTRGTSDDSFFDAAFWPPSSLPVLSPSLALIDESGAGPLPFEEHGNNGLDNEHMAQLRSAPDTQPFYSNISNIDYGGNPSGINYPAAGIDGLFGSLYHSGTTLQPVADATAARLEMGPNALTQSPTYQAPLSDYTTKSENKPGSQGQPAPFAMLLRTSESSRQPVPTFIMPQKPGHAANSSAYTAISPPSSIKSSPQKRSAAVAEIDKSIVAPKRRVIKAHMTAKVDNSEDFEIKKESEKLPTYKYQEYFNSPEDASMKLKRLLELYRKPDECCSNPSTDSTFPQSDEDKKEYVKKLFKAINEWESINEWSQTLSAEQRNGVIDQIRRIKEEANSKTPDKKPLEISLDEMRPSRDKLPPVAIQQKKILGRQLNDQTVEWLCWELIGAAIQSQQGNTQIPYWCGADGA
ncbi:hypothetical protein TASIC1_0003061100 [Trichoderma asperellum]|uniref:Uncharacterized protein n=1 Tax=Trichoderma asperellum TaxID=101201 RepID=A0A6V8QUW0_TRIAP|nr:hypothetical protein TASIC1_0003061100 [Trichoderma asperellum]